MMMLKLELTLGLLSAGARHAAAFASDCLRDTAEAREGAKVEQIALAATCAYF